MAEYQPNSIRTKSINHPVKSLLSKSLLFAEGPFGFSEGGDSVMYFHSESVTVRRSIRMTQF
jgi:hypothetical protein